MNYILLMILINNVGLQYNIIIIYYCYDCLITTTREERRVVVDGETTHSDRKVFRWKRLCR